MSEPEPEQEQKQEKQKLPDNLVFVGKKPFMNYINSSQYILREHDTIEICARGKSISKAVDIAEVLTERFMKNQIEKVSITTSSEAFDILTRESSLALDSLLTMFS